jgi:hypothetical protein
MIQSLLSGPNTTLLPFSLDGTILRLQLKMGVQSIYITHLHIQDMGSVMGTDTVISRPGPGIQIVVILHISLGTTRL